MATFNNFQLGFISEYIFLLHYFNIFFVVRLLCVDVRTMKRYVLNIIEEGYKFFSQITTTCLT